MKPFAVVLSAGAHKDFARLSPSAKPEIVRGMRRVAQNPLPRERGGYGKPLGGKLAGLFKIKFRRSGIRVVYALRETAEEMIVVVIGLREDGHVYAEAEKRRRQLGL